MSIQVDLTPELVPALKQLTKLEDEARAVERAAQEYLRLLRLPELKSVSGSVDFAENWQELDQLELSEIKFPA